MSELVVQLDPKLQADYLATQKIFEERRELVAKQRAKDREENFDVEPETDEAKAKDYSELMLMTTIKLDSDRDNLGKALIFAFWEIERDRTYANQGFDKLSDMIEEVSHLYRDPDYTMALARGVETILRDIWDNEQSGTPYKFEDGSPITVEYFLAKGGMPRKIKESANHHSTLDKQEDRQELIESIATKSADNVAVVRRKQQEKKIDPEDVIVAYQRPVPNEPDMTDLTIRVNKRQLELMKKSLGVSLDLHLKK